jgi:type II secretory pathway pseudopilin PulG
MKKSLLKKYKKGATLIELLIYFSILSILLVIVIDLMLRSGEFSLETSTRSSLQEDARFIVNRLTFDIHQADSISNPGSLGESGGTLILAVGADTHTYTLAGTSLEYQETVGASTTTANLNSNQTQVNSLTFERLGNLGGKPTIKVTFELETTKREKGGPKQKTFETVVGTR